MEKTRKVFSLCDNGFHFECIKDNETGIYKLYRKWYYMGYHRKEIKRANDLVSILEFTHDSIMLVQLMKG